MKSFPVILLRPGMVFSQPVYVDGNVFLPAGTPFRQKEIDELGSKGIESVQTDGIPGFSEGENTAGTTELAEPAKSTELPKTAELAKAADNNQPVRKTVAIFSLSEIQENKGAYRNYISLVERLHSVFLRISNADRTLDNRPLNEISVTLLQVVRNQRDRFVGFILGSEVRGFDLAKSSINTAILSSLTAQELKIPHHKALHIITGALLHDAGMLQLPREILEKKGGLSEAENKKMRSHPQLAYQITLKELAYPDEVGKVVLQHHERWDGTGYPNRIEGKNIDVGAQIVSIADAFEAMVSHKSYRNSMLGYQAMKNLMADNSRRFDPDILKAFILTMGIHPIGSLVCLNNGVIARVTDPRADAPLRPKIQVLVGEHGQTPQEGEKVFIDLLIEKNLYITKAVDAKEFSE